MSRKTEILQSIIDVWCRDQDIDAVLTHLSDDLVWHYSAISQPPKHGKAGAREFLEAYKAKVRNPHWRIFRIAETEDALFVEGVDAFDTADGHHAVVPYMGILEFDGDLRALLEDEASATQALHSGEPLLKSAPKSKLRRQFRDFAEELFGPEAELEETEEPGAKGKTLLGGRGKRNKKAA